ncbi:MAG TPA: c-type cytochrome [Longimicrobiaceae bacterium]
MRRIRPLLLVPFAAAALFAQPLSAQIPDHFENLKVLPKDIPRDTLVAIMRGFTNALGVRCNYCHVEQPPAQAGGQPRFNFASDDKAPKEKARFMIRMTQNLNAQVLPQVPHRRQPPVGVGCITCHRGLPVPTTLDRVLTAALDSGGAAAAVARYRQLRETQLASGRYDFSEGMLTDLGRRLAGQGKTAEAAALLELNSEFYPNSGQVDFALAEVYRMQGQRDKALVRYRMAQQKDPQNSQIQRRINELTGAAPAPPPAP